MKKIIIVACVLMSCAGAFAQHEVGKLTVQPRLGLNISRYTGSDNTDPRVGLAAGAEFEYQVTPY